MNTAITPVVSSVIESTSPDEIDLSPDEAFFGMFLHGRSPHTIRAYRHDINRLMEFTGKTLAETRLSDLQRFADSVEGEPETKRRTIAVVKSLFTYALRIGYLPFNIAAPLILPRPKNTLAERILTEDQVRRLLEAAKGNDRDHLILTVLYVTGIRLSELLGLSWKDCVERESWGQITVYGKRGKTRAIIIPEQTWRKLMNFKPVLCAPDDRVFPVSANTVGYIVKKYLKIAGIPSRRIGAHALRHSHATHALERGAKIHLVSHTLGHDSLDVTGRYLHSRPDESSSMFLAV